MRICLKKSQKTVTKLNSLTLLISASSAINMFYKQIILNRGIPFDVKILAARTVNVTELSGTELDMELEKGYADRKAGKMKPAKRTFADIRRD